MKVTTPRINFLSPRLTQVNRKRWLLVASHISAADWPSSSICLIFQYLDSPYLVASTFIIYLYIQCPCCVGITSYLVKTWTTILFVNVGSMITPVQFQGVMVMFRTPCLIYVLVFTFYFSLFVKKCICSQSR